MADSQTMIDMALAMLRLVVLASMPAVLVSALVGLLVGLGQAVTQLQDQGLPYAAKFLAVAATLALTLPWLGKSFEAFMQQLFDAVVRLP